MSNTIACLNCKQLEHKVKSRDLQVENLTHILERILIAANGVLTGSSTFDDRQVLQAIAVEIANTI